jgi:hypothetical protein
LSRFLVFAYFFEAGLLLLVAPWSAFWERNYFVTQAPLVGEVLLNHFVRGAVSGVGLVCLGAALSELGALLALRRPVTEPDAGSGADGGGGGPRSSGVE